MKTSKTITYKGHQIEVLRYATISPRNGRETYVQWATNIDGVRAVAYNVWYRTSAIHHAKQIIDTMEANPK